MNFNIISYGKSGKRAEVVVNQEGKRHTRHIRQEKVGTEVIWRGKNLRGALVQYDMDKKIVPDFAKPLPPPKRSKKGKKNRKNGK